MNIYKESKIQARIKTHTEKTCFSHGSKQYFHKAMKPLDSWHNN